MFERLKWPGAALVLGVLGALLRRWQLSSALDAQSGLFAPFAPASLALLAYLAVAAAVLALMAAKSPGRLRDAGRLSQWDILFAAPGDMFYLAITVFSALLTLGAAPLLLHEARQVHTSQTTSSGLVGTLAGSGFLEILVALFAAAACAAMLAAARNNYRMRGRGREYTVLLLPVALCCIWLLERYRTNAPRPALWSYVPLLLAIALFALFHLECASLSFGAGRARLLLWLASAAVVTGSVALAGTSGGGTALLLGGQIAAALAALWVVPGNFIYPPKADRFGLRAQLRLARQPQCGEEPENETDTQEVREEDHHV